ncbi:DEAD/DEAH box helicase [Bacillus canaveralius]|uniref:DEAD/DEAH box helicase n=1 Tax=Bacillus canaveralius TaxID=1403243 RepID=UPI000F7A56FD|nr:DEAD/DEAH box helicase [Bacillus canaveralius]RSK49685.1 DEAD/DEAH box helicase [Bacillus canaveralius]
MNIEGLPLRLLSAGAYQLAGFPALSLGLLNIEESDSSDSQILFALLRGDFPRLFTLIIDYWGTELTERHNREGTFGHINISYINSRLVDEIVKALGILCTYMRWEENGRLEKAQQKLRDMTNIMIYGTDNYSWLLSKIVSEVVQEYVTSSMRSYVRKLQNGVSGYGKTAFERYLRSNYRARKSLAWYSQVRGIERLLEDGSFALCTPTGSGKTTIAELAIIQSMFQKEDEDNFFNVGPIVMYLVPSRALATEVESKLGTVLGNLGSHSVKVTGLYGGIDWGPTDAWVTSLEPTVLICTYEKGEALIRFLGPLFLNRVSLVVIDEAHSVQFNGKSYDDLRNADDRSLRLEMLANRLLRYVGDKRIIALSAVADESESLAQWVSGSETATPVISTYRSTRQLIGRLEWAQSGQYEIRYDTLNGNDLGFNEDGGQEDVPYIQKPFASFPVPYQSIPKIFINEKKGVSKRQRPYLFWAAMQLAQPDEHGVQHSVLISITQHVGGYAEDFLYVLNKTFVGIKLPNFFTLPSDSYHRELFEKCLNACADYFGSDSNEFQLLTKGVVVHHGSMPGLLARLLVELIQKQIVHIAIATSTLSEGVNLPFETVIIPTLLRSGESMPVSEFKNLVGRAGRPGWGTEGRTLIFLESRPSDYSSRSARKNYFRIIDELTNAQLPEEDTSVLSPLGALMSHIKDAWVQVSNSRSVPEFMEWLERTVPLEDQAKGNKLIAEEALDSLDGFILSILVEQEMMTGHQINSSDIEQYLIEVWRKTYAKYVMNQVKFWERVFATRGRAVQKNIYPDAEIRRRLYRTSVSPRFGKKILNDYRSIREHLITGENYPEWSVEERLKFIIETVELISNLGKFKIPDIYGKGKNAPAWEEIMTWWMNSSGARKSPTKKQVSGWIKFVKTQFEYKFNWGLGTVLALILDDINEGALQETGIDVWPKTGLPWIVFWLKELINWGTLDPVAALLLANGVEHTRSAAEIRTRDYYKTCKGIPVDEILNPSRIKRWLKQVVEKRASKLPEFHLKDISVSLSRDFTKVNIPEWRVVPITFDNFISWIDPAGYELATSKIPDKWGANMESAFDFVLNTSSRTVKVSRFL